MQGYFIKKADTYC